ncbi:hypothetical protein QEJ31_00975 [Pigmentibacter sp. JX0631]|uniref:hydroxymethylbilane synthase n=1 Tax=Pigmentibacter sp. JX0631 TaxID=2976982 RepID=UPI00246932D5|nr:hypothetical protein [Pigmentibacter sp. JX0631]WGL60176.1 hypothetical protein QEJ31_00975 [Pigmentibacter sp. JX0631]
MQQEFKIATRKSPLALWQAETVQNLLTNLGVTVELLPLTTTGDKLQKTQLSNIQLEKSNNPHLATGKGLFIKEIQEAILTNNAHLAVHSMKDLPVTQTKGLSVVSLLPRAGKHDVLLLSPIILSEMEKIDPSFSLENESDFNKLKSILFQCNSFFKLPIGTTSSRRQMLLKKHLSPNLNLQVLRGNVDTRLTKLNNNEFSAIILAEAGLQRLNLFDKKKMFLLPISLFIPAPAQGVVAVELKDEENKLLFTNVLKISHSSTVMQAALERLTLFLLGGDCHSAVGVCCEKDKLYVICERNGNIREAVMLIPPLFPSILETLLKESDAQFSKFFEKLCQSFIANEVKQFLLHNDFSAVADFSEN